MPASQSILNENESSTHLPIKNLFFPKMRSKLSLSEMKLDKKLNMQLNDNKRIHVISNAPLRRSFSLLNYKKTSKILTPALENNKNSIVENGQ